jgi:hypothetical protein
MSDPWADALPLFREVMGVDLLYSADDLGDLPRRAIKIDEPADDFQGLAGKARRVSFEIDKALLPREPGKGDLITEDLSGAVWRVNDIGNRDGVGAWIVIVEEDEE